jgi:ParB family chromosome partitioning protein
MDTKRVLIVEPDHAFALALASLFREDGCETAVAGSAAEAEMEIASRRPQLVVVRAELPDLSGFSLCAQLRHDLATASLPIVLFSSDTPPESLAEHARTPWAANGYLAMPLDTDALRMLASRILSVEPLVENADDAILEPEDLASGEPAVGDASGEPVPEQGPAAAADGPTIPALPRRSALTDDDRLFLDRVFQSIEHRDELMREAMGRRPPPRRELMSTPEGRMEVLRSDLKWREAQLARIAEIWEVHEREVASFDQRIHEKEVDLEGLRVQVDDLSRRLAGARDHVVEKEREYGASIDGLLLEKFSQEKQLIEVVAASERRIHELERDVRRRDDDLARRRVVLAEAQEEIARLDRQSRSDAARLEARESELARRSADLAAAEEALTQARRAAEDAAGEAARRLQDEDAARKALEAELETVRAELGAGRAAAEAAAAAADAERDRGVAVQREVTRTLQERIDEREAAIQERDERLRRADEELRRFRESARAREEDLTREVQDHLQQIAALEAEIEGLALESAEREERGDPGEGEGREGRPIRPELPFSSEPAGPTGPDSEWTVELQGRPERIARAEAQAAEAVARAAASEQEVARLREALADSSREFERRRAELEERGEGMAKLLAAARKELERLQGELSGARQGGMILESQLRGELEATRRRGEELTALVAQASLERDELRGRHTAVAADLETREAELASASEEAREARAGRERAEIARAEAEERLAEATRRVQALEEAGTAARPPAAEPAPEVAPAGADGSATGRGG